MGPDCRNSFLPAQDIQFMLYLVKKTIEVFDGRNKRRVFFLKDNSMKC